jgi:hypothetical protein
MTTEFVLDADTGYDRDELPPVPIRVDGKVYEAHCPKDSLPVLMARLQNREQIEEDPGMPEHLVRQILLSIFEEADAEELMDRLLDMAERKVTLAYVIHVVRLVADHYETDLEQQYSEMGMNNPLAKQEAEPANREQRRALAKAPAKKAPAKKTAAKKTPAARR